MMENDSNFQQQDDEGGDGDDGARTNHHPSVYEEAEAALHSSLWMYLASDLRQLAREGKLAGDEEAINNILSLPATSDDLLSVFDSNQDRIRELACTSYRDLYYAALEAWIRMDQQQQQLSGSQPQQSELLVLDDDNADTECVYSVSVLHAPARRVVVAFRGSVTPTDWMKDVKAFMRSIPNPAPAVDGGGLPQMDRVGIHHGFQGTSRKLNGRGARDKACDVAGSSLCLCDLL